MQKEKQITNTTTEPIADAAIQKPSHAAQRVNKFNPQTEQVGPQISDKELAKRRKLIDKYKKYMNSKEYLAILFVKKYLKKESENMLIDITNTNATKDYDPCKLQFKQVKCALYLKLTNPTYPPRPQNMSKKEYKLECEALDWITAQEDIRKQKRRFVRTEKYVIDGVRYINTKKKRPPILIPSAPEKIKAMVREENEAKRIPERAWPYINPEYLEFDEYSYKVECIRRIGGVGGEEL